MRNQNYTNRNHPNSKMREVSLPRLLLLTLRRWRSMLLVGLLLAVLLAGMKVLREYKNRGVSNEAHEEYLARMAVYNASVEAYNNAISRFQAKIDAKQKYFNESLLMQVDPHAERAAFASLAVRTPGLDEAAEGVSKAALTRDPSVVNASNIVHAYIDYINNGIVYDKIASSLGAPEAPVPEQSVRELVAVSYDQYHFSSVFKIQVRSSDAELSSRILDHILDSVAKKEKKLAKTLGEHEVSVLGRNSEVIVDTALLQQQTELQNSIATLQKNLQTSQTSLKELIKPSEATGASTKTILKHGIKYGVVGMAGGILLMVFLHAVRILMTGKILTDDEINVAYGLRNLMTLPSGKADGGGFILDRFVEKLLGGPADLSRSAAGDVLLARVENLVAAAGFGGGQEAASVLLVGTVDEQSLESLASSLEKRARDADSPVRFSAAPGLDRNADSIRSLREADGCIVVEEVGESCYRNVAENVELALSSGRPILGTVYI